MKVGPKGQVVIPRAFRRALKISSGSKVIFKLDDKAERMVIEKPKLDAAAEFERIAKTGRSARKISPHAYEEQFEQKYSSLLDSSK